MSVHRQVPFRPLAIASLSLLLLAAAAPWRFVAGSALPSASVLDLALLACAAIVLLMALAEGAFELGPRTLLVAFALAPIAATLSVVWSEDMPATVRGSILAVEALVAYMVGTALGVRAGRQWVTRLLVTYIVANLVVSALFYLRVPGFGLYIPPGGREDIARLVSALTRLSHPFIGLSNDYAPILGTAALLTAGLAVRSKDRRVGAVAGLGALAVVLTLSRGALLALLPALMLYLRFVGLRWRTVIGAGLTTALLLLAGREAVARTEIRVGDRTVTGAEIFADRFQATGNVTDRLSRFAMTIDEAEQRPFLGAGAGVFDPGGTGALADGAHNTVLEQVKFFGGVIGTLIAAAWLVLPLLIWHAFPPAATAHARAGSPAATTGTPERAALLAAAVFLVLASLTQTFMEATVPRVIVHLLLGVGVGVCLAPLGSAGERAEARESREAQA